uniref:Superoxide dismutase [Mn], mitochondrial n=1 Tax=Neolamprologus brichardi TaxID=32507 RepID=A0A3Q4GLB1_NEOBR
MKEVRREVAASRQKHTLPDLTYDYGALEPYVSAEIMQLHHSKHHATYVNNLNVTEEKVSKSGQWQVAGVEVQITFLEDVLQLLFLSLLHVSHITSEWSFGCYFSHQKSRFT